MKAKPKVIFIYNPTSGKGQTEKNLDLIISEISKKYGMCDVIRSMSPEHLIKSVKESCYKYDYLFFSGGDGTFNMVVNAIPDIENLPIFGYLPGGTTTDMSYNLNISRKIKKGIKDLMNAVPKKYNVGHIGNVKFIYVADLSTYGNAIHATPKSDKKKWGVFAYIYYLLRAFIFSKSHTVYINGVMYKSPLVMISNSREIASFIVNRNYVQDDGLYYACIVKDSALKGLINIAYTFAFGINMAYINHKIDIVEAKQILISTDAKDWDVDGESVTLEFPTTCGYSGRSITVLSNRK